jgi:hypothetical protein
MNNEIIALARGSPGGVFGLRSKARRSKSGLIGFARASSSFSSHANANPPMPIALDPRKCRREEQKPGGERNVERGSSGWFISMLSKAQEPL